MAYVAQLLLMMAAALMIMSFGGCTASSSSSNHFCSKKLQAEFQFGVAFKPEVESLINVAFPRKEQCAQFAAFIWAQLEQWSANLGQWSSRDEAFRRHQAGNVLLIAHYRATRGELISVAGNSGDNRKNGLSAAMLQRIEMLLKDPHFEEELFLPSTSSGVSSLNPAEVSCTSKVNRTVLMMQTPLSPLLAAYLDSLKPDACGAFQVGLQSALALMTNFSGTGADLWTAKEEPLKLIIVQALLRLLYICANSNNVNNGKLMIQGKNADVAPNMPAANFGCSEVFSSELLLGEIFNLAPGGNFTTGHSLMGIGLGDGNSTGVLGNKDPISGSSGSAFWNLLFWAVILVTVLLALYLVLRFLEVIPGVA